MSTLAGQSTTELLEAASVEHARLLGARRTGNPAAETAERRLKALVAELVRRGVVTKLAAAELMEGSL